MKAADSLWLQFTGINDLDIIQMGLQQRTQVGLRETNACFRTVKPWFHVKIKIV